MLGHLSNQRNDAKIALKETKNAFREADVKLDFELKVAPLKEAGQVVCIK